MEKYLDYIAVLQDAGIKVMGSFIFGFDHDTESIFDVTLEFLHRSGIVEAEFLILTPYPKTPLHDKLSSRDASSTTTGGGTTPATRSFAPRR